MVLPMVLLLPVTAAAASASPSAEQGAMAAMADSAAGWNTGDLARFMRVYADDAAFVTPTGVIRGRQAIGARYLPSFAAGGNRRGRLSFQQLYWRTIDPRHGLLIARWTLTPTRPAKPQTGMTSLLFAHRADGWRIVSDHSS